MNIFKFLIEIFVIYLVYKLIFEFIIPVYKTSRQMRQNIREMQQKMQQQPEESINNKYKQPAKNSIAVDKTFKNDYIEYEEIK